MPKHDSQHPGYGGTTLSSSNDHSAALTPDQSFTVHLQSLDSISQEIGTQFDGLQQPESDVAGMLGAPIRTGDFIEASGLGTAHNVTLSQMQEFLGQVKAALQFADEVTAAVTNGYRSADAQVAQSYAGGTGHAVAGGAGTSWHQGGSKGGH